jgi:DNA-binding transcriptional LysR family regulator
LEEQLGVLLLHRDARRIVPTDEGCRLYDRVATSVDAIDLALQATRQGIATPRGSIRLTAPPDLGRLLLLRELAAFCTIYPEIDVEVELTDRYVDLVQEGFDLALRAGRGPSSAAARNLMSRVLMHSELRLAAAAELANRVHRVDDLSDLPFVLFRAKQRQQRLVLQTRAGRLHPVLVHGRFVVHDYTSMAELVSQGAGIGLMPSMHIDHPPPASQLQPVLPQLLAEPSNILLVYPTRQMPRRVSLLVDHLTEAFADRR